MCQQCWFFLSFAFKGNYNTLQYSQSLRHLKVVNNQLTHRGLGCLVLLCRMCLQSAIENAQLLQVELLWCQWSSLYQIIWHMGWDNESGNAYPSAILRHQQPINSVVMLCTLVGRAAQCFGTYTSANSVLVYDSLMQWYLFGDCVTAVVRFQKQTPLLKLHSLLVFVYAEAIQQTFFPFSKALMQLNTFNCKRGSLFNELISRNTALLF